MPSSGKRAERRSSQRSRPAGHAAPSRAARPPAQRGKDPRRTREALLAAGAEVFASRGFDGARTDEIARRAGVNKALIHYHFRDKQGLYAAIVGATLGPAVARLRALGREPMTAEARLRALIAVFAESVARDRHLPAMLVHEMLAGSEAIGEEAFAYLADFYRIVAQVLEAGADDGSFRRVEPYLAHVSLVGGLVLFFATEEFRRKLDAEGRLPFSLPTAQAFVRHTQELMCRGLASDRPARRADHRPAGAPSRRARPRG